MLNNVALDVVIGLILVYLLYSLLITVLGEMLATWLGMRARILRIAIERMLNDGLDVKANRKIWPVIKSFLARFFLTEPSVFKSSFAGAFYEYPSIKYLAKLEPAQAFMFGQTKPSYISPDNFAATVINMLCDKGTGNTRSDQLQHTLKYNAVNAQPETIRQLRNIYNTSGNDITVFKTGLISWYDQTMDRANGWYKRKIGFLLFWLGFLIALFFNIDSIQIARILSKDKEARNQLVNIGIALNKDSSRYTNFVHTGKDTMMSQAVLDSGLSHISKDINAANLILGLGWHFEALKSDSIIVNDTSRFTEYKFYEKNLENTGADIWRIRQSMIPKADSIKVLKLQIGKLARDTITEKQQLRYVSADDLTKLKKKLNSHILEISNYYRQVFRLQTAVSADSACIREQAEMFTYILGQINTREDVNYRYIQSIRPGGSCPQIIIKGRRSFTFAEKTEKVITSGLFGFSFWGFLITAFALSLGAPFWFGLLNKLVSLRGAGVKPSSEDPLADDPDGKNQTALPAQKPPTVSPLNTDPLITAVEELKFRFGNMSGVLSISAGFLKKDNKKVKAIEIYVVNQSVLTELSKKIGETYNNVPVNYMINTIIQAHFGGGAIIVNMSSDGSLGTLGCFAKNHDIQGDFLMSCWHVLQNRGDSIGQNKVAIANAGDGNIGTNVDIGFALLKAGLSGSNKSIGITADIREVNLNDAETESKVKFYGGHSGAQNHYDIVIYNNTADPQKIFYTDINQYRVLSDLFSITRYVDNMPTSPTRPGDSGAIITDENGHPLGMIVGGDTNFSYAIKLTNVFAPDSAYKQYYIPL